MPPTQQASPPDPNILPATDPMGGYETPPQQPTPPKSSRLKWVILGAVILVLIMAGVSYLAVRDTKKTPTATPAATTATDGYTFTPPNGWTSDQTPQLGATASFSKTGAASDSLPSTIAIIKSSAKDIDLDKLQASATDSNKTTFTDYSEAGKESLVLGSAPAFLTTSTFTIVSSNANCLQLVTIKGDVAYTVTAILNDTTWSTDKDAVTTALKDFRP